jgi:Co/Zn/Cd efflux system component
LLVESGKVLLDRDVNQEAIAEIRSVIEADSDNRVSDLHVWRVSAHHLSAIISIVTHFPKSPDYYKKLLADYDEIAHVTVEVNPCKTEPCSVDADPAH